MTVPHFKLSKDKMFSYFSDLELMKSHLELKSIYSRKAPASPQRQ